MTSRIIGLIRFFSDWPRIRKAAFDKSLVIQVFRYPCLSISNRNKLLLLKKGTAKAKKLLYVTFGGCFIMGIFGEKTLGLKIKIFGCKKIGKMSKENFRSP